MQGNHIKGSIIGYLDNITFYDDAEKIGERSGIYSDFVRQQMTKEVEGVLKTGQVPFLGPIASMRYPVGGYFFKTKLPENKTDLKQNVLQTLQINDSLLLPFAGSSEYNISLGFLVKAFPENKNHSTINFSETDVLNLASHLSAFYRQREKNLNPYFYEVNEEFEQRFPVNENLDYT